MGKIIRNGKIISPTTYIEKKIKTTPYERPADWLPIPQFDHDNKDEVYILNGVGLNCLNQIYFVMKVSQPATIDWGDGTVEQVTTTAQTTYSHQYNYENISDSSYTEHNKTKQVLIHISTARGSMTYMGFATPYYYTNEDGVRVRYDSSASTDIYEINADVQSCEAHVNSFGSGINFFHLEIFDWKGSLINTDMYSMFSGCNILQSYSKLDMSKITSVRYMFRGCGSLQTIPQFDTSNVTIMSAMFYECGSLQTIPRFDTSKVTDMSYMFDECGSLQTIPQLNTSKVTDFSGLFERCYSLLSIPQLDTSKATNMYSMVSQCHTLQSMPELDASNVTDMRYMFSDCYLLQNPKLYNAGASSQASVTISNLSNSTMLTKQALIDLFNSVAPNNVEGHTRTLQLGSTLQRYLANQYVKDSGQLYTAILPTQDTTVQSGKTYYTYNDISGEYTEFTGSTFESGTFYYELKTATWNTYVKCESTDEGSMLALDYMTNIKKWTVT